MVMLLLDTSKLLMMKVLRVRELLLGAMGQLSSLIRKFKFFRRRQKVLGFMAAL